MAGYLKNHGLTTMCAMVLIIFLGEIQRNQANEHTIQMNIGVQGSKTVISCDVTGPQARQLTVHLQCPLVKTNICYSNCSKPTCHLSSPSCKQVPVECAYQQLALDRVRVQYTVDTSRVYKTGMWRCSFRDIMSNQMKIDAATTTTSTTTTTTPIPTTEPTTTTSTTKAPPSPPPTKPPNTEKSKPIDPFMPNDKSIRQPPEENRWPPKVNEKTQDLQRANMFGWFNLTRPELVFVLLGVLGFSLLINVVFCIRCALIKSYIDGLRTGDNELGCLECCLCMTEDPYHKLTQRRSRFDQQHPHPNGMVIRGGNGGDQIYEDLPGSSLGEASNFLMNTTSGTPRPSTQLEIDPVTGMIMTPLMGGPAGVKMSGSLGGGGTFPRQQQHAIGHHRSFQGSAPLAGMGQSGGSGGYMLAQNRAGQYILMPVQPGNHPSGNVSPPGSQSSQVLLYDDVPVDMRASNSTGAIYGYPRRFHIANSNNGNTTPIQMNQMQHNDAMMRAVAMAAANVVGQGNLNGGGSSQSSSVVNVMSQSQTALHQQTNQQMPNQNPVSLTEQEESGICSDQNQLSMMNIKQGKNGPYNGSHMPSPPLAAGEMDDGAASGSGSGSCSANGGSNRGWRNGEVSNMLAGSSCSEDPDTETENTVIRMPLPQRPVIVPSPPLPPYPPLGPGEDISAYTVDLIQHCSKTNGRIETSPGEKNNLK